MLGRALAVNVAQSLAISMLRCTVDLGWFKSAKNFICQKVQKFWADSGYVGKIDNKKIFKNFFCQCLALPKDRQSFCEVQKKCHQIFSKFFFYSIWIIQMFQKCKNFQKIPIGSGYNSRHKYAFSTKHAQKFHHPVVPQRMKKKSMIISPTSNWIFLKNFFVWNPCIIWV